MLISVHRKEAVFLDFILQTNIGFPHAAFFALFFWFEELKGHRSQSQEFLDG
jgi:hypothetical protein